MKVLPWSMSIFSSFFSTGLSFSFLPPAAGFLVLFADMLKQRVIWPRDGCRQVCRLGNLSSRDIRMNSEETRPHTSFEADSEEWD